jgi:hypothetical protein
MPVTPDVKLAAHTLFRTKCKSKMEIGNNLSTHLLGISNTIGKRRTEIANNQ